MWIWNPSLTITSQSCPLAQCQAFLRKHHFEAVTDFDTAGAAKLLAENGGEGKAALASKRAAEAYGLAVLAENVEDLAFNYTRFFVLGADAAPRREGPAKTSLVLATRHRPGDLVDCLVEFPKHGINMTKLESRPRRDKPWSYLFYIDIEGHVEDAHVAGALTGLMRKAAFVKFLGSYPAGFTRCRRGGVVAPELHCIWSLGWFFNGNSLCRRCSFSSRFLTFFSF
ncbi:MAG: prephenate dehydratase domain-containing protein [Chloroflexota bacterium]